ncbi:hypothetical protein [Methanoregula sp.]|uniref:hypothetical protein n=1 Tax=Methanoregula sp. TaxID=2052170 RepID=UPI002369E542|nr:hypothetical protein [Methanoregula sp.]MDD1687848.1 hypothetical protein [Methanoregula sp.]
MTRGPPPGVGLKEAKALANRQGKFCQNTKGRGILYDFAIYLAFFTIHVRVRRTRMIAITPAEVLFAYGRDIARLRRVPVTAVSLRELWVRTSAATWQYFLVLDDQIVEIPAEAMPENTGSDRHLREDALLPDRSTLPAMSSHKEGTFACPLMGLPK